MEPSGPTRYSEIVDDWDAFLETSQSPLPYVVRTNTLKIDSAALRKRLLSLDLRPTPYPWCEELFEVSKPPGASLEHWLGLYYVQEAVQAVPVLALDPQPDETILDLCAAPGGKSTYISARMQNQGTLVANEPSGRRQMALLANINRLGVLNAMIAAYRGENFPMRTRFDRILVDAPCSAEGTLRKESSVRRGATTAAIGRLTHLQKALIVRAFDLLAPGGVLVYSTCTFAPEENESVVAHLLRERDARIVPIEVSIPSCPGLEAWQDEAYPKQIQECVRIYPHHLNSGGGFVARIAPI